MVHEEGLQRCDVLGIKKEVVAEMGTTEIHAVKVRHVCTERNVGSHE